MALLHRIALVVLVGCNGVIGDASSEPRPIDPIGDPTDPGVTTCASADDPAVAPLRRLTRAELEHTLRDLLGDIVFDDIEIDFGAFPNDDVGAGAIRSFAPLHSSAHIDAIVATADRAAESMLAHPAALRARGLDCILGAAPDAACVQSFVEEMGLRVFRRPPTEDEIADYVAFHAEQSTAEEGFRTTMMRFLASPDFLFHLETEGTIGEGGELRLDAWAVASRISYMVTGSMPSDALFAAAESGELLTVDGALRHVHELLEGPAAREHVLALFTKWLNVERMAGVSESPAILDGLDGDGLGDAMREELERYVDAMFFEERADYRTLLTSPNTYAEDLRVAEIYGVAPWAPETPPPSTGPERGGLLHRAALLVSETHATAPILRGVFVRRRVLCDDLPTPSSDIIASRLDELEELDPSELSSRRQIELITAPDACQNCHVHINPAAFVLEEFDRIGRYRTVERIFEDEALVGEHPLDLTVTPAIVDGDTAEIASAMELSTAIAESGKGAACFARRIFEHTRVREPTSDDACLVGEVGSALHHERISLFDAYVASVARESILTRRLEEE